MEYRKQVNRRHMLDDSIAYAHYIQCVLPLAELSDETKKEAMEVLDRLIELLRGEEKIDL